MTTEKMKIEEPIKTVDESLQQLAADENAAEVAAWKINEMDAKLGIVEEEQESTTIEVKASQGVENVTAELTPGGIPLNIPFKDQCFIVRGNLLKISDQLMALKRVKAKAETNDRENAGEVMANIMLAYRHLEDARMRIWKVIQAFEGGVSNNDK